MKKIFYDQDFNKLKTINILIIVLLFGAVFGFIWETSFYRIFMNDFAKRGSAYGPIVPIYGFGAVLIVLLTYRFKEKPLWIFIINTFILGLLEYNTGWVLFEFFDLRLWDYNTEIWNFGNLNGYVCARSIGAFGFAGVFLIYFVLPFVFDIVRKSKIKTMTIISFTLLTIFVVDIITYILT